MFIACIRGKQEVRPRKLPGPRLVLLQQSCSRAHAGRTCSLLQPCSLMARITPMTRSGCWMRTVLFCSSGTCGHSAVWDLRSSAALISPSRSAAPRSPSRRAVPCRAAEGRSSAVLPVAVRSPPGAASPRSGEGLAVSFPSPPALEAESKRERLTTTNKAHRRGGSRSQPQHRRGTAGRNKAPTGSGADPDRPRRAALRCAHGHRRVETRTARGLRRAPKRSEGRRKAPESSEGLRKAPSPRCSLTAPPPRCVAVMFPIRRSGPRRSCASAVPGMNGTRDWRPSAGPRPRRSGCPGAEHYGKLPEAKDASGKAHGGLLRRWARAGRRNRHAPMKSREHAQRLQCDLTGGPIPEPPRGSSVQDVGGRSESGPAQLLPPAGLRHGRQRGAQRLLRLPDGEEDERDGLRGVQ